MLAILHRLFGFIASTIFNNLVSNLSILSVPDEGYYRNVSCVLRSYSTLIKCHFDYAIYGLKLYLNTEKINCKWFRII